MLKFCSRDQNNDHATNNLSTTTTTATNSISRCNTCHCHHKHKFCSCRYSNHHTFYKSTTTNCCTPDINHSY